MAVQQLVMMKKPLLCVHIRVDAFKRIGVISTKIYVMNLAISAYCII